MFRVIRAFRDKDDNLRFYHAGATYPRDGLSVSAERLAYLAGSNNRAKTPLIEMTEDPAEAEGTPKRQRRKKND